MIVNTPINQLSYGLAGYNICKELERQNKLESLIPIGDPDSELFKGLEKYHWVNTGKLAGPQLRIWHQWDISTRYGKGIQAGFPFFEMNRLNRQEHISMYHCDILIVASAWAKEICQEYIDSKITIAPLGVDRTIFNEKKNFNRSQTIFMNCGKWEVRKGHDILLKAFNLAFDKSDNVELWMLSDLPFPHLQDANKEWRSKYKNSKLGNKINIISRVNNHIDVYNLIRHVDCGIFPSRAEGWNMPALEFLSCGKHLIITDYSAHTEYANEKNSKLININKLETAQDGVWFHGQGEWAALEEPQLDQLVEHMRNIHLAKKEGHLGVNVAGIETAEKFSWSNTVSNILGAFNNV